MRKYIRTQGNNKITYLKEKTFKIPRELIFDPVSDFSEGDVVTLSWSKSMTVESVKLQYSFDGVVWTDITTGETGTNYSWDTTGIGAGTVSVRVVDEDVATVSDTQTGIEVAIATQGTLTMNATAVASESESIGESAGTLTMDATASASAPTSI